MSKLRAAFQKLLNSRSTSTTSNSLRNSSFTVVATHSAATARSSSMPPIPVPTGGPYHFSSLTSSWVPFTPSNEPHPTASSGAATPSIEPRPLGLGSTLNLITWNIDFVAPHKQLRVHSILRYLRAQLSAPTYSSSTGTLILLQEIRNPVEGGGPSGIREGGMIHAILEDPWVREEFFLSNIVIRGRYGTATLVSRGIQMIPATPTGDQPLHQTPDIDSLQGCFRVASPRTIFDRDILVTDLVVSCRNGENGILRICNTHLESLAGHGTEVRPLQLALGASLLRKDHVTAGIIAGDMNACEEPDFVLIDREDINLRDVWVEITGKAKALELDKERIGLKGNKCAPEDPQSTRWGEEGGHTWGYQSRETEYFPRRLDKVLFCENERGAANVGLKWVEGVERLGIDVKTSDVDGLENVSDDNVGVEQGDGVWLSDHFGLLTKLVLTER